MTRHKRWAGPFRNQRGVSPTHDLQTRDEVGGTPRHPKTRLEQAYNAILNCALVGLRVNRLRATDRRGHHVVALESLSDTLGVPDDRVDYFQMLRDLRNKDLYTGGTHVTVRQAEEAIAEAHALRSELERWLGEREAGSR